MMRLNGAVFLVTPGFTTIRFSFDGLVSDFIKLGHKNCPPSFWERGWGGILKITSPKVFEPKLL
jgi:hypothetical protein